MTSAPSITIAQVGAYVFTVDFGDALPALRVDEAEPIGGGTGPHPEQMLIAAVANCLCASLVFALGKFRQNGKGVSARASCRIERNEDQRLRIVGIDVRISLGAAAADMPRIDRVLDQFQRFCTVSESVKLGIPVAVTVRDGTGTLLTLRDRPNPDSSAHTGGIAMPDAQTDRAETPEALARLFNRRANAGDVEGLVALYEPDAVLAAGRVVATGHAEIRAFYADLLARRSDFPLAEALPPLRNGTIAMTFARLPNGTISVETAREQADGTWLWVIDQLKIKPADVHTKSD